MPKALLVPMSAAAEAGRGVPMAGLPPPEMITHAVPGPTTEAMPGEITPEVIMVERAMIAVSKAAPIKAVRAAAIKSVTEGGSESVRAGAMGDGGCRRQRQSNDQHASFADVSPKASHGRTP
jgi:hypothetical protein